MGNTVKKEDRNNREFNEVFEVDRIKCNTTDCDRNDWIRMPLLNIHIYIYVSIY